MHHFILWKWRGRIPSVRYEASYVNAMVRQLRHRVTLPHRVLCVTDDASGITECESFRLWADHSHLSNISGQHLPSCYRRLKIFDRPTQELLRIPAQDRIVSIDLDAVLTNTIDSLLVRPERFVGWHVAGSRHKVVYNGSMFMLTAGDLQEVWSDFHPVKSPSAALIAGYMGSDQAYLSHKLIRQPYSGGWTSDRDGVLSFVRNILPHRRYTRHDPIKGCIVFFAGRRKPWHADVLEQHPWIHECVGAAQ